MFQIFPEDWLKQLIKILVGILLFGAVIGGVIVFLLMKFFFQVRISV